MKTVLPQGPHSRILADFFDSVEAQIVSQGVRLELYPNLNRLTWLKRGFPLPRMHQPLRQKVPGFVFTAEFGGETVATYVAQCILTGDRSLKDVLDEELWYRDEGKDRIRFDGPALRFAEELRGVLIFSGGLWSRDRPHCNDESFCLWWKEFAPLYGRALALEIWDPDWWWSFVGCDKAFGEVEQCMGLKRLLPAVSWTSCGVAIEGPLCLGLVDRAHQLRAMTDQVARSLKKG